MYFGEFLIKKGVITSDQLILSLAHQLEALPSLLRVLYEEKSISADELTRIIAVQYETNSDLVTVLRDEKIFDEKRIDDLYRKQSQKRQPLGQILVKLGHLEQSQLEKCLGEFFQDKENINQLKVIKERTIAAPSPGSSSENNLSDAAIESLKELGIYDASMFGDSDKVEPMVDSTKTELSAEDINLLSSLNIKEKLQESFVDEFGNLFSEKMYKKLKKVYEIVNKTANDGGDVANYFNSIYRDIHVLKGSCVLAEIASLTSVLSTWEEVVESVMNKKNDELSSWVKVNFELFDKTVEFSWTMRQIILSEKNESVLLNDAEMKKIYCDLYSNIKHLKS